MCLSLLVVFRSCCCNIVSIYLCVCVSEQVWLFLRVWCVFVSAHLCVGG